MFRLKKLKKIDLAKTKERKPLLEAIYDVRLKLNKPEYASATTDIERQTIFDKSIEVNLYRINNYSLLKYK